MATTAAMAYVAATVVSSKPTFFFSQKCLSPLSHTSFSLNSPFSKINNSNFLFSSIPKLKPLSVTIKRSLSFSPIIPHASTNTFHGLCYVLSDNIDTDQIIPAEHLTLVPSKPDEYRKLGSLAFSGLPSSSYPIPFIDPAQPNSLYSIILAGANFGCGSSREHAPVALGAAGIRAVVAESYARIFFRNSVATGEVYPLESEGRICDECNTGDVITIELDQCRLINHTTGKEYQLKPIGDAGPVIEAGGIFAYARKTGMIASTPAA